jgi:hypothetical protein
MKALPVEYILFALALGANVIGAGAVAAERVRLGRILFLPRRHYLEQFVRERVMVRRLDCNCQNRAGWRPIPHRYRT